MAAPTFRHQPRRYAVAALLAALALLGGCASQPGQGYGQAAQQSTAAQAQQQMQAAEQANQVDTVQTYLDLIVQMQQAGQWYASLAHTEAFEQQHGANVRIRLLRADALRNTGQVPAAQQAYTALLDGSDSTLLARARRGLGLLHASQGQYAQAVSQFEQARRLNPIDASVLSDLAYAHMLDGQLAPARLPIQQAAQLAPANARVQLNLALFWLASGEQAQAAELLQKLSQPQAKNAPALIDEDSLQTLQAQLAQVRQAVHMRAAAPQAAAAPAMRSITITRQAIAAQPVAAPAVAPAALPPAMPQPPTASTAESHANNHPF
ncbi:tetratricopeptide repeat protein [Comamonas composti]|uniref:tetratricopeptide repeat protein n=1 Tax=Comamonas composti TaxID=408558 RepID=UPI0006879A10|nr:tetratricopeptide repeat protein [Comamonas composti]